MHRLPQTLAATAFFVALGVAVVVVPTPRPAGFVAAPSTSALPAADYHSGRSASGESIWAVRADAAGESAAQLARPGTVAPLRAESARVEQVARPVPAPRSPGLWWTRGSAAPGGELQS